MSFRDDFLNYSGVKVEPVETPAGPTFVRSISAGNKDKLEIDFGDDKEHKFRCRVVMYCCCNAEGQLEFGPKDMLKINGLPIDVVDPIVMAASKLNGFRKEEQDEMVKNSPSRDDDSSSDSQ